MACAKFGSIFGVLVLEEKIPKFGQLIFTILLISHLRKVCYPYDIPALTRSLGRSVLAVSSEVPLQCSHLLRQEMIRMKLNRIGLKLSVKYLKINLDREY